jgi:hypothetical protein
MPKFSFATHSGQPRHFSPDFVMEYNSQTGQLRITEKGEPVFFNDNGTVSEMHDLLGVNPAQFVELCELLVATSVVEHLSYHPSIANGVVTVTFKVNTEDAVAAES